MSIEGDLIREVRTQAGLSLRALAERSGTSASTLAYYESGAKEPRLSTLRRVAEAAGAELVVEARPKLTVAERRAHALHLALLEKLDCDPEGVRQRARRNLARQRQADQVGNLVDYLDAWKSLIDGPEDRLRRVMQGTDQVSLSLQQMSPFAGTLDARERRRIIKAVA
jgi:transcriptional regulator with XRE-family HTH domain